MSNISENKTKIPLEIISNLLSKLLDSKLSKLEAKNKDEMNKIKSISQNSETIISELKIINKKIIPKKNSKKPSASIYPPLITSKKNNIRITRKLNTTISYKNNDRSCDTKYYTKIKTSKNSNLNNNIKKLKLNRSEIFMNDFLSNKSNVASKILNLSKTDSKLTKKSRSKKKRRDLTPRPTTPNCISRKAKREKTKHLFHNTSFIKLNNNSTILNKNHIKSCKNLPLLQKKKLNIEKMSKHEELDLICSSTQDDDKRIYDLNPDLSKNILLKNANTNKKMSSLLFSRKSSEDNNNKKDKEIVNIDDSMMNEVNNDELLIFYHSKKTMKLIDDITLTKSFLGDDPECDIDVEINIGNPYLPGINKNNNYTFAERLESCIDYFSKYLTKEELLKIGLINKESFKMLMHFLISKTEDSLDDVKEALSLLKKNNSDIIDQDDNNNNFSIKPFECNIHSSRAITLLNYISIDEKTIDLNNKYIILVFDLFFIALGYKKKILSFKNDSKAKWDFYKNYFEKSSNKIFGNIIENKIKGKIFDNDIINSLYEYSHNYINIITPSYFQKINNEIALFVFIVKNILEHVGITKDVNNKKNAVKLYLLYNARISKISIILQKLNKINSMISNK